MKNQSTLEVIECPRDAMQGWHTHIPTQAKIDYLNHLLKVGFDVLDFGSFVSPKAIPQMADTKEVLEGLDLENTTTELLAIIANTRGAHDAVKHQAIKYLGFPFSISETFQQKNTNKSIQEALEQVIAINQLAQEYQKELVIYISMGFGNPYGDPYSAELAIEWVEKLYAHGIRIFAMSDTVGVADTESITEIFSKLIPAFPDAKIGAHFHSTPATSLEKLSAAYAAGCRRFDASIHGIGGCPMAKDELVGNIDTKFLITLQKQLQVPHTIDEQLFTQAQAQASKVFI